MAAARLRAGSFTCVRWVDRGELGEDERHDGALPEAGDDLPGRVGEERCVVLVRLVEGAGEIVGFVDGVCVGEEQMPAAGMPVLRSSMRCFCR